MQNILRDYSEDKIVITRKLQDGVERFDVRNDKYKTTKHSILSDYKSALEPHIYRVLFKFATIRNPWDMLISYYFHRHRGVERWNKNDFIRLVKSVPTLRYYITTSSFFEKSIRKLHLPIQFSKKGLDSEIDFLIKFENIDEDFKLVCENLDFPYSPLPKRNKSLRKHYSYYYDEELKEIVRAKFIEEIIYGNYEFKNA
jgi:hypothetical protein